MAPDHPARWKIKFCYQGLQKLQSALLQHKTQFYLLRYTIEQGPTTENAFIHRLACVLRYHMVHPVVLRRCMSCLVMTMVLNGYPSGNLEPTFSFLFRALPQIAQLNYIESHKADIFVCEEIGQPFTIIPELD